jgi:hypothetical protein
MYLNPKIPNCLVEVGKDQKQVLAIGKIIINVNPRGLNKNPSGPS